MVMVSKFIKITSFVFWFIFSIIYLLLGGLLVTGILDRFYKSNLTQDEALNILIKCTAELKSRFLISQYDLFVKIIDKSGIKVLKIENGVLVPLS